jgi:outer membrane protein OmpA-like peptidoglycan-associated protein
MAISKVRARSIFVVAIILVTLSKAALAQALPDYLGFLSEKVTLRTPEYQEWDEAQIPTLVDPTPDNLKHGKHWHVIGDIKAGGTDRAAAWQGLKSDFLNAGWEETKVFTTGTYTVVLHYAKNNTEAWASADFTSAPGFGMTIIEAAPIPRTLVLPTPATTSEKIAPNKDFPFLPPIPIAGTKPGSGGHDPAPFSVTLPDQERPEIVARGSTTRSYHPPSTLSAFEWAHIYHDALTKAHWTIVNAVRSELITAHYGENGRNIWAYLHINVDGYRITVGDEPAGDALRAELAKNCHVALLGVLFDFNKSTLKPESDAVLERVGVLMTKDRTLRAEIQGHTDNVGAADYNVTLSQARAASVAAWLTTHGIQADRLTSKGYGLTMPIADNKTDEGRAKNRRVEIADLRCQPKTP